MAAPTLHRVWDGTLSCDEELVIATAWARLFFSATRCNVSEDPHRDRVEAFVRGDHDAGYRHHRNRCLAMTYFNSIRSAQGRIPFLPVLVELCLSDGSFQLMALRMLMRCLSSLRCSRTALWVWLSCATCSGVADMRTWAH